MHSFNDYRSYVFIFAHPDDEIYTVATISSLVASGKRVKLVYLTNGDYAGADIGKTRQLELTEVVKLLGVSPGNVMRIGLSERLLFDNADVAVSRTQEAIGSPEPNCIVSHDYEGGHNAHDLTSFCAYLGARKTDNDFWVFPAYHGQPDVRRWNQFIAGRSEDYVRQLNDDEQQLKRSVVAAHASQREFFDRIMHSNDAAQFSTREVLRFADGTINYRIRPTTPLGYELLGKTERFDELQTIVGRYL